MFNFDQITGGGLQNFKLSGTIRVSVSDGFSFDEFASGLLGRMPEYSWGEVYWTQEMISGIQAYTLSTYSKFANLTFTSVTDRDTYGTNSIVSPFLVGWTDVSDINITFYVPTNSSLMGVSGLRNDSIYGYPGGAGDIYINPNHWLLKFDGGVSFGEYTKGTQVLMHELGHSLGLSHPHSASSPNLVSRDYGNLRFLGFDQLGFRTDTDFDMNKEYFSIMSYDDESIVPYLNAYTPMILDVIALSQAYGEGQGTHGIGNDMITAGTIGYRTFFDKGGIDTIDLSMYSDGAYLQMGVVITGATHLVGVSMSGYDAAKTIINANDPESLRWFYGEYENAQGSYNDDLIIGAYYANTINGNTGADYIDAMGGDDSITGGDGDDTLIGGAGNDTFDWDSNGRGGNDILYGGTGNDVYVLNSPLDSVIEYSGEGEDTIWVNISYSINNLSNIENLRGVGSVGIILTGNEADNLISGSTGNDTIYGGTGNDKVFFNGSTTSYSITKTVQGYSVRDTSGINGVDTLINIERLQFSDKNIALDVSHDGNAGKALEFIGMLAFNKVTDKAIVGEIISYFDQLPNMHDICQLAISGGLTRALAGGDSSNAALAQLVFRNVVGHEASSGDVDSLVSYMDGRNASYSQADFLSIIAGIDLNQSHVNLVGLQTTGLEYTEYTL
jgi:Ca2+-binding RTX toxin-like protein